MTDHSPSGNRWEPSPYDGPPVAGSDAAAADRPSLPPPATDPAPLPPRRPRLRATSLKLLAAGLVIFLGGGAGGYAVAHASTQDGGQDPAPAGTRTGVPGQTPFDRDGDDRFRGDRPGGVPDGDGSDGVQPDDSTPGSDT